MLEQEIIKREIRKYGLRITGFSPFPEAWERGWYKCYVPSTPENQEVIRRLILDGASDILEVEGYASVGLRIPESGIRTENLFVVRLRV